MTTPSRARRRPSSLPEPEARTKGDAKRKTLAWIIIGMMVFSVVASLVLALVEQ